MIIIAPALLRLPKTLSLEYQIQMVVTNCHNWLSEEDGKNAYLDFPVKNMSSDFLGLLISYKMTVKVISYHLMVET